MKKEIKTSYATRIDSDIKLLQVGILRRQKEIKEIREVIASLKKKRKS